MKEENSIEEIHLATEGWATLNPSSMEQPTTLKDLIREIEREKAIDAKTRDLLCL